MGRSTDARRLRAAREIKIVRYHHLGIATKHQLAQPCEEIGQIAQHAPRERARARHILIAVARYLAGWVTRMALKWSGVSTTLGSLVAATIVRVIAGAVGVVWADADSARAVAANSAVPNDPDQLPPESN